MGHAIFLQIVGEFARDITGAVITQQPGPVPDFNLAQPGKLQRIIQCGGHIAGAHAGTQSPGGDKSRKVIQYRRQVIPSPADNLEVGEIGLPQLIHALARVLECLSGLHQDIRRAGYQIPGLQHPVNRALRDKVPLLIGIANSQLAWRELRLVQGQLDDRIPVTLRDLVPSYSRSRFPIFQIIDTIVLEAVQPVVESGPVDFQAATQILALM